LFGAGQAAAQSRNSDKAQHYFSKLVKMAGAGEPRADIETAQRYLAGNMKSASMAANDQKTNLEPPVKPPTSGRGGTIVVQNYYYALPGREDEVYRWRLHASDVREKLGFPRGRVLRLSRGPELVRSPSEVPDVIWECEYPDIDARERDVKAVEATPEFQAVQKHMRTLFRRFERGMYVVGESLK
jgi:hypothetical protein